MLAVASNPPTEASFANELNTSDILSDTLALKFSCNVITGADTEYFTESVCK